MNFTERLLIWGIITYLCSTTNQYVNTCMQTVGSHMSVATRSKVVQYWESEHVRQFYSGAILFCLTPPTAALYPSSPVMFLLLLESHFVFACRLSFICSYLQLSLILVLSHYSLPSGYCFLPTIAVCTHKDGTCKQE